MIRIPALLDISESAIAYEAQHLSNIPIYRTSKAQASMALIGIILLNIWIFSYLHTEPRYINPFSTTDIFIPCIFYGGLAFFIFRGSQKAMLITFFIYTAERMMPVGKSIFFFQNVNAITNITKIALLLFLWALVVVPLYKAYRIESLLKSLTLHNDHT